MSIYKRGKFYWTRFEIDGKMFNRSLETPDEQRAKGKEKFLVSGVRCERRAKTEIYSQGDLLRKQRTTWSRIAERLIPEAFRENPRTAAEAMRQGVTRWRLTHR